MIDEPITFYILCALLKAAFLCTEVVKLKSEKTLADQLREEYNCGFELHTWSNLPQGSGMGTSSILAGAACAVIGKITEKITVNKN